MNYELIVKKMKAGYHLTEQELSYLVYDGIQVDEIEGNSHRWTQRVQTILDIDGELWAVNWERGLTECQESEFYNQPYRVEMREKQIVVKEYIAIKED